MINEINMERKYPSFSPPRKYIVREVVYTGCGFALGFGWLWFPALAGYWLPDVLWGKPWGGGGTTFFLIILIVGFSLFAYRGGKTFGQELPAGENSPEKTWGTPQNSGNCGPRDFRRTWLPNLVHAGSLIFLGVGLLPPWPGQGFFLFLPSLGLALSALLLGIYWGGAVIHLPPRLAGWSLAVACVTLALLLPIYSFTFEVLGVYLLLGSVLTAWWAAEKLGLLLKIPFPEPKRPRGRPSKKQDKTSVETARADFPGLLGITITLIAFFVLGLNLTITEKSPSLSPCLSGLFTALGGVAGAWLSWAEKSETGLEKSSRFSPAAFLGLVSLSPITLIVFILLIQGIIGLADPTSASILNPFWAGLLGAAAAVLVAGEPTEKALVRASRALILVLLLSNLGAETGGWLRGQFSSLTVGQWPDWGIHRLVWMMETGVGLALLVSLRLARWQPGAASAAPPGVYGELEEPAPESAFGISLTAREEEILELANRHFSNKQIAACLHVQEATVRFHLRNIYQKTGLKEREDLLNLPKRMEQYKERD